jgi:hypothetical protein
MTTDAHGSMLFAMGAPTRRIVLEIDEGSDPISGDLADGQGTRRFSGWLELADALQAALGPGAETREDSRHDEEGGGP